jgi:hypothetical protein
MNANPDNAFSRSFDLHALAQGTNREEEATTAGGVNAAVRNRLGGTPDRGRGKLASVPALFVLAQNSNLEKP